MLHNNQPSAHCLCVCTPHAQQWEVPRVKLTLSHRSEQITGIGAPSCCHYSTRVSIPAGQRSQIKNMSLQLRWTDWRRSVDKMRHLISDANADVNFRIKSENNANQTVLQSCSLNISHPQFIWFIFNVVLMFPIIYELSCTLNTWKHLYYIFVGTIRSPSYHYNLRSQQPCVQFTPLQSSTIRTSLIHVFYHFICLLNST